MAPSVTSWHEPNNKYGITVTATDDAGNSTVKDRTDSTLSSAYNKGIRKGKTYSIVDESFVGCKSYYSYTTD